MWFIYYRVVCSVLFLYYSCQLFIALFVVWKLAFLLQILNWYLGNCCGFIIFVCFRMGALYVWTIIRLILLQISVVKLIRWSGIMVWIKAILTSAEFFWWMDFFFSFFSFFNRVAIFWMLIDIDSVHAMLQWHNRCRFSLPIRQLIWYYRDGPSYWSFSVDMFKYFCLSWFTRYYFYAL